MLLEGELLQQARDSLKSAKETWAKDHWVNFPNAYAHVFTFIISYGNIVDGSGKILIADSEEEINCNTYGQYVDGVYLCPVFCNLD